MWLENSEGSTSAWLSFCQPKRSPRLAVFELRRAYIPMSVCDNCGAGESEGLRVCECGGEYCENCEDAACEWCSARGWSLTRCPSCSEVWFFEWDFVCVACIRQARDEGHICYCVTHGICFLRMPPMEGLPDGLDDHPDCNTVGDLPTVDSMLRRRWSTL